MKKGLFVLWILTGIIFSCKQYKKYPPPIIQDVDVSIPQQIEPASFNTFDSTLAGLFFEKYPLLKNIKADWYRFYRHRHYSFAWADSAGITQAAQNLHNRVNNLTDDGLNDSLLYRSAFNQLFDDAAALSEKDMNDTAFVMSEMMLTAQYFMYAGHIYGAFTTAELKKMGWNIHPGKISYTEYLTNILSNSTAGVFDREPVFAQYGLLKEYLKKYRAIEAAGGWPLVDTAIKKILPGDSSKRIVLIKKRLFITGDLEVTDRTAVYDSLTIKAIKQFRTRHGLKDTSLIDQLVIREMNVPVKKRIEQILVNMERCRWLPYNPGAAYIAVNIPDYKLYVYENNRLQWSMNVVVGQAATKTVIFNDTLTTIAFSPYWNVPYSIYKNELRGRLSASYLRRNNIEITGPGRVRQKPGANNALGKVKFLFPNSYSIYFHDTPAKDKFNYTNRAFSHGCIRLANARKMADYLLRNEKSYSKSVIDSLMNLDKEVQIRLKNPLPVYIGYFTAFVQTQTGQLHFRKDIYQHDPKVLDKLMAK